MDKINDLVSELSRLSEITAITLGGSRASGYKDENSDYDVYVYCEKPVPAIMREAILRKYCKYIELANTYWEEEDDCILNSGTVIELIYRDRKSFEEQLEATVINGNANNGYTTCMWCNLMTSIVLWKRWNVF